MERFLDIFYPIPPLWTLLIKKSYVVKWLLPIEIDQEEGPGKKRGSMYKKS